ncbi:hypothetical protein D3C85_1624970 [compost metagenome]
MIAVSTGPGLSTLTRMRRARSSSAQLRANAAMAAFEPAYTACPSSTLVAARELVKMMLAPSRSNGMTDCTPKNAPRVLMLNCASNSAGVT